MAASSVKGFKGLLTEALQPLHPPYDALEQRSPTRDGEADNYIVVSSSTVFPDCLTLPD